MNLPLLASKDFWAGLLLIATGAAAVLIARNYSFGSSLRMGPGYFPTVLGGLLILFGIYLLVEGLRSDEKISGSWSLRALILLPLALVLFGVLMEHGGFVPAMLVLIFISGLAGTEFKVLESLLFAIGLTALAAAVFVWGLGLPYPLFTNFQ
jgi:uncharacterized membrane protein